jgi:putative flippase GtrA
MRPILGTHVITSLTRHVPPGQFGRYLVVGAWNTFFGYGTFAALTAILDPRLPHGYLLAAGISSMLSITIAFLGYKWFVFKTKGDYWREWARCVAVYSSGIILGMVLLPILVFAIRRGTSYANAAPYIGGALLLGFNTIYNFIGHKKFSFRTQGK